MSYSTGEIAELCGVTVRTVQYYDREGLLKPERFSEEGRRLYGEESLKTLHLNSEMVFCRTYAENTQAYLHALRKEKLPHGNIFRVKEYGARLRAP